MIKYLLLLILPLLSFGFVSCGGEEDDIRPRDLFLLEGVWEVVDQGSQDVFPRTCLIDMTISPGQSEGAYGGYHGFITTFFLTVGGTQFHDKVYGWNIRGMEDHLPLLDLVLLGELDGDDQWAGNHFYRITRLSDSYMWWQGISNGDNCIIRFRRRTDIQAI